MSASSAKEIAQEAKAAFEASQLLRDSERGRALLEIQRELEARKESILAANKEDLAVRGHPYPTYT